VHRAVRRGAVLTVVGFVGMLVAAVGVAAARNGSQPAAPAVSDSRQQEITAAASEFGVPAPLLLALAGTLSGYDPGTADTGTGLFRLTEKAAALDGRGGADPRGERARAAAANDPAARTLITAAGLVDRSPAQVRDTPAEGARAAAALLRSYAVQATGGEVPSSVVGWYGAVARFATGDAMTGRAVADDVFARLRAGVAPTVVAGQRFSVPADPSATVRAPGGTVTGECDCRLVPASGYTPADRETVDAVVVSTAPAGYTATIAAAQRASARWSAHYVVGAGGAVTQTVLLRDAAWHTGDPALDARSVGITVEAGAGATAYASVGRLLRQLADRGLAVDRQHVLGADEVAGSPVGLRGLDWAAVLKAAGAPLAAESFRADRVVTVAAPGLVLRDAPDGAALARQPAVGRQLAVAEKRGAWTAVRYGGRTAWFTDPAGARTLPGGAERVVPAAGRTTVAVLGQAGGTEIGRLQGPTVLLDPDTTDGYLVVGWGDTIGYVLSDQVTLELG
jgi:hypothetical protein